MVLLDRIVAMLITATIIIMGLTVQTRAQKASADSTMLYMAKTQTLQLADMIEHDLGNVGYGTTPDEDAITTYSKQPGSENLDTFEFWGIRRDSSAGAAQQVKVRYTLTFADSVTTNDGPLALYQLTRSEQRSGSWVEVGSSTPSLESFSIDLLNETNTVVTDIDDARRVRVSMVNGIMPQIVESINERMNGNYRPTFYQALHWRMTVTPTNIRGYQGR
jgi:hypothetical protein